MKESKKTTKKATADELLLDVLHYFNVFDYPVTFKQLHIFCTYRLTESQLKKILKRLLQKEKISFSSGYYALGGHPISASKIESQICAFDKKMEKTQRFFKLAQYISTVSFIGLSGSCAMGRSSDSDDVDVFIVSAPGRIWTTRLALNVLAHVLFLKRKRKVFTAQDKVCLNLFFDERDMRIPNDKINLYTAHEVVQLVPLFIRGGVYRELINKNNWVHDYFPNITSHYWSKKSQTAVTVKKHASLYTNKTLTSLFDHIEKIARSLQLWIMKKHITTERINDTQLWFFPKDFERTIEKKIDIKGQKN